jgi:hypothetical protein
VDPPPAPIFLRAAYNPGWRRVVGSNARSIGNSERMFDAHDERAFESARNKCSLFAAKCGTFGL